MTPGKTFVATKKPARSASAVIRDLFDAIDASGLSAGEIGKRAGSHQVTLCRWKHGRYGSPRLVDVENVAQVLGYRLALVPIEPRR